VLVAITLLLGEQERMELDDGEHQMIRYHRAHLRRRNVARKRMGEESEAN
jgi:hypothetical protein